MKKLKLMSILQIATLRQVMAATEQEINENIILRNVFSITEVAKYQKCSIETIETITINNSAHESMIDDASDDETCRYVMRKGDKF